ncbi:S-adenosyl-L-methionine-dependent methyltransferase [Rhizoclosmatium globosum]|uniref:S-adenosyl-L-methionine-dependent methyltransferase n=1 Tax=Rhizoclosmatium globosum TaxID=329046 RepID=A0A1Y2B0Q5_9FUNG|nr:S-adenosyl-L-methionine-dependent methyltransferase [Rhizoclosmatium globosum]|eukprot:ORY28393.1 S-adenosyl-L-methionine-dependent methyltransferase [Rhizoclosmatium globosum]
MVLPGQHQQQHRFPLRATPPLVLGSVFAFVSSAYLGFHVFRLSSLPSPDPSIKDPLRQRVSAKFASTAEVYSSIADSYDSDIGWDEWFMGLDRRRRSVAAKLKGNVIETAAGTGRNLRFIAENKDNIQALTLTDASPHMLERAFDTFKTYKDLPPTKFSLLDLSPHQPPSTSNPTPIIPPTLESKFDTVLDTFGLCSYHNPTQSLENMLKLCKPNGQLILLEHGRSVHPIEFISSWINDALDKTAQSHANRWGCWWNRDLETIIRNIKGLQIESVKRYHFGTTIEIIARKVDE